MSDLTTPSSLRRLIEESGHAFAVIEQAVDALREQIGSLPAEDPDVTEILRAHLLAIGSPSDAMKFFSLELLERLAPKAAQDVYLEVIESLARSPVQPERTYPLERAVVKRLGEKGVAAALPALAVLAGREIYPLSRTAARAVASIVGSTDQEAITERLKRDDLPEATQPLLLGEGVCRALFPQRRSSAKSSQERRREITRRNALPSEPASVSLRPESERARQRRLKAILRSDTRDPSRCGNCEETEAVKIGHVVPTARGGTDRPGNLVPLCGECRRKLPRGRREAFEEEARPSSGDVPQLNLF